MYSSTPPYETSRQWSNEVNQRQKIKFRVVAPGERNEDASWVIKRMTEILNNSRTFYCFLCRNLSKYEFVFENASEDDFNHQDYVQKQYAYKDDNAEERCYRDIYSGKFDSPSFILRDSVIRYYAPKEELVKNEDNVFTLAFTKCDAKSEGSDFSIDCRYSIWDNQTKTFYVRGRLGPYTNVTKGGIPSLMADHLVIALGLY
jgi:hypothetical protein